MDTSKPRAGLQMHRRFVKYNFEFLTMFGLVQGEKSNTCPQYKVIFQQIPNVFDKHTPGSNAPVSDGFNKNKCLVDILFTLVICLTSSMQ